MAESHRWPYAYRESREFPETPQCPEAVEDFVQYLYTNWWFFSCIPNGQQIYESLYNLYRQMQIDLARICNFDAIIRANYA